MVLILFLILILLILLLIEECLCFFVSFEEVVFVDFVDIYEEGIIVVGLFLLVLL